MLQQRCSSYSREGIFLHGLNAPFVAASLYKEEEVSGFFVRNRIKEDSAAEIILDHTGSPLFPLLSIPTYLVGRVIRNEAVTRLSLDIARLIHHHAGTLHGIVAYLITAGIAYQRLGAGEHYLADVVGGAALGFGLEEAIVRDRHRKEEQGAGSRVSFRPAVGLGGASGVVLSWIY